MFLLKMWGEETVVCAGGNGGFQRNYSQKVLLQSVDSAEVLFCFVAVKVRIQRIEDENIIVIVVVITLV